MPRCPYCDQDNAAGASRCEQCGATLPREPGPAPGPAGGPADALERELRELLASGGKIAAIRRHREATGADLRTAKDAVEAIARRHGLDVRGAGCLGTLLLATLSLVAASAAMAVASR
jgi:hypothetical protein